MTIQLVIIGAGRHAEVLAEQISAYHPETVLTGFTDSAASQCAIGPLLGGDDVLPVLVDKGTCSHFLVGIGSVGRGMVRGEVYNLARQAGLRPWMLVHPTTEISSSAVIAPGCQILARAVINTKVTLGENVLLNTGAIVEHHSCIGAHCHIATGAMVCGGVLIGERTHIGAGSVIRQGITIGDNVVVGAGAVVVRDVSNDCTVVGNPARALLTK